MHFLELIIQTIYVIWRRYNFEVYLFTLKIKIVNRLFGLLELKFSFFFHEFSLSGIINKVLKSRKIYIVLY